MKEYYKILFIILLLHGISTQGWPQYSIKGKLLDSQGKYSFILLEYLPSIHGLNRSVADNIINRVKIDSDGYFSMSGHSLPKEKRLYRLSLVKRSVGTSISNGIRKNYILLELDPKSQIELLACGDVSTSFGNCLIKGSPSSQVIQGFYDQLKQGFIEEYHKMYQDNDRTALKEQFLHNTYSIDLKNYCDTSTHLNAALIAYAHLENRADELNNDQDFFDRFKQKISSIDGNSPYVKEVENEIASFQEKLQGEKKDYSKSIIRFLSLCLVCLSIYTYFVRKQFSKLEQTISKEPLTDFNNKLDTLSKKELEVYELIVAGNTNKEIASVLFIETTTVKSHISKIYQKLGVKNRKDAILKRPKTIL